MYHDGGDVAKALNTVATSVIFTPTFHPLVFTHLWDSLSHYVHEIKNGASIKMETQMNL